MRRDFSESAQNKLCNQIQEINNEQWFELTDAIGDFFTLGVNINKYLNRVDVYHKKILDKNDTTIDDIEHIFTDVRTVDSSYKEIFARCKEALTEQIEYIRGLTDCIGVSPAHFNAAFTISRMKQYQTKIINARIKYYVDKLKYGNGDAEYDYDYLREIMQTSPENVPKELYAALIVTFNEMTAEQKELFIESSYFKNGKCFFSPITDDSTAKYEFVISDVFSAAAIAYAEMISGGKVAFDLTDPNHQSFISNYSLMRAIAERGNKIYITGVNIFGIITEVDPVDVDLTDKLEYLNSDHPNIDYTIRYNGSSKPYNDYGMLDFSNHQINTYSMRDGDGIDYVFDIHAIEEAESLRVDIGQEKLKAIVSGVADEIIGFAADYAGIPGVGVVSTVGSIVMGCVQAEVEGNRTNNAIDNITELLIDGNTYKALSVVASFSVCDGKYQIHTFSLDKDMLNASIQLYQQDTGVDAGFTADEIFNRIQNGTLQDESGLSDFVRWYNNTGGGSRIHASSENEVAIFGGIE